MHSADFADFNAKQCLESFLCWESSNLQVSDVEKAVKYNRNIYTCGSKMSDDNKNLCHISQELVGGPLPLIVIKPPEITLKQLFSTFSWIIWIKRSCFQIIWETKAYLEIYTICSRSLTLKTTWLPPKKLRLEVPLTKFEGVQHHHNISTRKV